MQIKKGTGHWNIDTDRNNCSTQRKIYPSAPLSVTNITWTDQASNPDLHDEKPSFDISSLNLQFIPTENTFLPLKDNSVNAV
jgi:hypothetical protein